MNLDKAVFTSRYILKDKLPVLHVVHDADDEWQFLGGQDVEMEDMLMVSLQNILDHDSSIERILELPMNSEAHRSSPDVDWIITPLG